MLEFKQENYLTPDEIELFIGVLPQVISKRKHFTAKDVQWSARIQYICGLRITEALTLMPSDFDLEHLVLTLNHTKTGFKRCKCSTWHKRKLIYALPNCPKCKGLGKYRIPQFTTIPPQDKPAIETYLNTKPKGKRLFNFTRKTAWKYYKEAGKLAGLNIREQQTERAIEGIWTHLLRKCRAKLMEGLGAKQTLIKLKLRHTFDTTETYTRPDIQLLKKWEYENLLKRPLFLS